jgi:acetyltransferase-like isoleucine patch superfamily enzyme
MNSIIFGLIFLCPPFLKKRILSWYCGAKFGRGACIGWFSSVFGRRVELGDFAIVKPFSVIRCDGDIIIGAYSEISSFNLIYGNGSFQIGRKCYIGPQSLINATEDITIGNRVGIGARAMIYTHGSFLPYTEGYWVRFAPVTIGNDVWIAAGVFIHPGVEIGDKVFVNSRSVVTTSLSSGCLFEGFPAKMIGSMAKIRRTVRPAARDELIVNILNHYCRVLEKSDKRVHIQKLGKGAIVIRDSNKNYIFCLMDCKGELACNLSEHDEKRKIFLSNFGLQHPGTSNKSVTFDFTALKATFSKDKICSDFFLFAKQYYGLFFEYEFPS